MSSLFQVGSAGLHELVSFSVHAPATLVYSDALNEELKHYRFDGEMERIVERVCNIRNSFIAHLNSDVKNLNSIDYKVSFQELKTLRDKYNKLLDALAFNVEHVMLPLEYDPTVEQPRGVIYTTDIEEILHSIARTSAFLNMPEQEFDAWQYIRNRYSESDLDILNEYRLKFGLPTA